MKHWTFPLAGACVALVLQGCDVRIADTSAAQSAPPTQPQVQQPVASTADTQPVASQATLPVQQPAEPVDAQVAANPQAPESVGTNAQAAAAPDAALSDSAGVAAPAATAVMGAAATPPATVSSAQGTAAPTRMGEFVTSGGTPKVDGSTTRSSMQPAGQPVAATEGRK